MAGNFQGSTRRRRLPSDWPALRRQVIARDHGRCRYCGQPGNQVDHIAPGDNHQPGNLQTLCDGCHGAKTAAEGNTARWARRRRREGGDPHPGQRQDREA